MKRSIRAVTTGNRYRAELEHGIVERANAAQLQRAFTRAASKTTAVANDPS
jgi:hypothetical protein